MKKLMWIVSFFSLIGTVAVLQFLPETIPMHYDTHWNVDRWGSRNESLIFPVLILAMSLFWQLFLLYYEKKARDSKDEKTAAEAASNAKVIAVVGLCQAVFFTVMHGVILYGSYIQAVNGLTKQTVDTGRITLIGMGILFIILGNIMPKTRINGVVGFRISWSMYNDTTWKKTNRFGAITLMIAGVLTILLAAITKNSVAATFASIGLLILATIVTLIYAHKVYVAELKSEKGDL